jgi:hypothetical protein
MEKVVYVVWKRAGQSDADFAAGLRAELPRALAAQGARGLSVSAVDDAVAAGAKLRLGKMDPPKSGIVAFWLEQSQEVGGCEEAIRAHCGKLAGYLVVESRPIVNTAQRAPAGQRTPGFALVTCIAPHPALSYAEFIDRWYRIQRDTAIETQSTFGYVRNEVVRALSPAAPRWAGIVEENFPIGALSDPMVFYDSPGDPAKFERNVKRMRESCDGFLAMDAIESHPMSEFVYERLA